MALSSVTHAGMSRIAVLNGPNLNLLGTRDPAVYGAATLNDIEAICRQTAAEFDAEVTFHQSNHEGELIDIIHASRAANGMVINAGAFAHTSFALRDAIAAIRRPAIEVHISNVYSRESFRHVSTLASVVKGSIVGLGAAGYALAIRALLDTDSAEIAP